MTTNVPNGDLHFRLNLQKPGSLQLSSYMCFWEYTTCWHWIFFSRLIFNVIWLSLSPSNHQKLPWSDGMELSYGHSKVLNKAFFWTKLLHIQFYPNIYFSASSLGYLSISTCILSSIYAGIMLNSCPQMNRR